MVFDVNVIFYVILGFLIFDAWITFFLDYLNKTKWTEPLSEEWKKIYNEVEYKESMEYQKVNHNFWTILSVFYIILNIVLISVWFFGKFYDFLAEKTWFWEWTALPFFGILILCQTIISLPFSYYATFVIEEKFWFNKSTKKIFFLDLIKRLLLTFVIWGALLSAFIFIYWIFKESFWIFALWIMILFMIFSLLFAQTLISPLFNKQTPLEDWELKDKIQEFAKKEWFKIDNIFVIDWSKRSTKANAYFSWIWSKKRIVLYDTLINDLTTDELVAVLAHEIWHYKKKHIYQALIFSVIQSWILFYLLWLTLSIPEFSIALWSSSWSFALWVLAFWIIFSPFSFIFSVFGNILTRKNEYEADEFSAQRLDPKLLQSWLIKLSKNNLTNLNPHPLYEFVYYSHPVVLKRLKKLETY